MRRGLWVVACSLAGCGGDDAPSSAPPAPSVALRDYPAAYADAACARLGPCCDAEGFAYDQAACTATLTQLFSYWYESQERWDYDGAAAAACLEVVKDRASRCAPVTGGSVEGTACDHVFRGKVKAGGTCAFGIECIVPPGGFALCVGTTCEARGRGKAGEACAMSCRGSSCTPPLEGAPKDAPACFFDDGSYCAGGVCEALLPEGAACTGVECAKGLSCAGTCTRDATLGESCELAACSGSACAPKSHVCVPYAEEGAPCASADQCTPGLTCDQTCREPAWLSKVVCGGM